MVLGVLVALGLGAIATEIGWRIEVRGARDAMAVELGELIGQGEERVTIDACVERRLDELARIVADAGQAGRLPPLGEPSAPPYRTWPVGVWQSTLSAQTAAHLDREVLDNYSTAYDFAEQIGFHGRRELDIWTSLYALSGPGRPFGGDEARSLRHTIAQARLANRMVALNGVRMKQVTTAYQLGYDKKEAALYGQRPRSAFPICRPIGSNIPANYGAAPGGRMVRDAIADPITRESLGLDNSKR
ncbi:hypothetical protein [Sphingomonas sp.]|uniref:hypothetical protein n=1 Tax=Sphingomonas sp. TaxID=28214 RepID=UPI002D80E182|nr:hypothetical protein [Sphingomonas sp.]HEU0044729.1 hypothetical protein [Sphingomonas sp.]